MVCDRKASWQLSAGLFVNFMALVLNGLIDNLPEGLFILIEASAIVLMLWGIVLTRRKDHRL